VFSSKTLIHTLSLSLSLLLACARCCRHGQFSIEWNFAIVAASVVDAVVVAIAGYWILFRLLLWKV
jgi:hypothetical protein